MGVLRMGGLAVGFVGGRGLGLVEGGGLGVGGVVVICGHFGGRMGCCLV